MATEIIEILEYVFDNPVFNAAIILYAVFSVIMLVIVIAVFAVVLKNFFNIYKRHNRR